jgi:hypothetical protein
MSVAKIIADIGVHGIQDQSRFSVALGTFSIPSSYIISVDLPGPKFDLANVNYWEANQYHRLPVGLRFEDPLILNILIPEGSIFANSLSNYMTSLGLLQPNAGVFFGTPQANFFQYTRNAQGIGIDVTSITKTNQSGAVYRYRNCFLEKILPIKFDATQAQPLYTTLVFAVGGMS